MCVGLDWVLPTRRNGNDRSEVTIRLYLDMHIKRKVAEGEVQHADASRTTALLQDHIPVHLPSVGGLDASVMSCRRRSGHNMYAGLVAVSKTGG